MAGFFQQQYAKIANALFGDPLPPPEGQDGNEFGGGGAPGVAAQESNRMGAGRAPFTVGGVTTALGNAMGLLGGTAPIQTGALSIAEMAGGVEPGSWGGIANIEGQTPYDQDLYAAVHSGKMRLAKADQIQEDRNRMRAASRSIAQAGPGGFNYGDAGMGRRGIMGGGGGGNAGGASRSSNAPQGGLGGNAAGRRGY